VTLVEPRLCIVGDVHGHARELRGGLERAGLIDVAARWVGGRACLAVLGDLMDRGPDGVGVIDLLMRLQREAPEQGGKVVVLLGNHEVLFIGAKRFGSQPIESRGGSFFNDWLRLGGVESDFTGVSEARLAWLEELPAMALERDHLLVHADSLLYVEHGSSIDEVNSSVRAIVRTQDPDALLAFLREFSARYVFQGPEGPDRLNLFLSRFGGSRVVHGHSPIARVAERPPESVQEALVYADGKCINVDPGMYLGGPGFVYEVTSV
jgi:hypothetical protein